MTEHEKKLLVLAKMFEHKM